MKHFFLFITCVFSFTIVKANNLVIGAPTYDHVEKTISFNISWDNSWKITTGPANMDGVWVFVKRQACSSTNIWSSAILSTTSADHSSVAVSGSNLLTVDAVADGMGVYIRRTASGTGNISAHTIKLKFNSTLNTNPTITTSLSDNFKVLGMEMVYVPQGGFYIGDGRPVNTSNFSNGDNVSSALYIDEAKQTAGLGDASVYTSNPIYGCPKRLPATFPLGYNGFWCMKYEISTVSFVEFLNTLTYDQQAVRLSKWNPVRYPNGITYFSGGGGQKVEVYTQTAGTYNTIPAIFSYNVNEKYTPVGYLGWLDLTAFLDWSGLRPMTEFEFEKLCRGPLNPVAYEYPWGNTLITKTTNSNSGNGSFSEKPTNLGEGLVLYAWEDVNWVPFRSGYAATSTSTRSQAAATYYGILDIAGNMAEQVVGGGSGYDYSNFTTTNGDGVLGTNGNANVTGWPTSYGISAGNFVKGGSFDNATTTTHLQVSDRTFYKYASATDNFSNGYYPSAGGRGIRSHTY